MKALNPAIAFAAAALFSACVGVPSSKGTSTSSIFDKPPTAAEIGRQELVRASLASRLASGMSFRFTGTATNVVVSNGAPSSVIVGQGTMVLVTLVKSRTPQYELSAVKPSSQTRHPDYLIQPGDGGGDGGGGGTPAPFPTAPPNVGSCQAAGGAAWADPSGTGCLGPGGSRRMSCGLWQYSSPGRGKLITTIPGTTVEGGWVADDGNGTCGVGA